VTQTLNPILAADSLCFAYGEHPALREVSLTLSAGEIVSLLGPNGSGKSTLIKLLLGHLHGKGKISWDRRDLDAWSRRELARRVAYLPQSPMFDPEQTVREVLHLGRAPYWVAFGLESQRDLDVVNDIAQSLALNDLMSRRMDQLSGGQRQRVFLARCLVQQPAALLLDEPSTFLDLKHQVELIQLLRKLSHENQLAVLMASHDLNLSAAGADRLILLSDGKLIASGSPNEVLNPQLLSKVYGIPMERITRATDGRPIVIPLV
jgi:iron complex transport system ATP-binding protein